MPDYKQNMFYMLSKFGGNHFPTDFLFNSLEQAVTSFERKPLFKGFLIQFYRPSSD